ncbi:ABC transporter substrate-binding protein [Reyranella sp.]|uniref:ABC transporter substrate-binding protein n=1 Tax=Reyranella sp. TaxID=1929291 RepID=UPI003D138814
MVFVIRRREIVCVAAAAPALAFASGRGASAQGKTGSSVYPVAVPTYEVQFVAMEKGFFKDEGYDFKLIQGGSGVKTREILASRQGDFAIADILHVLQLNKNGRPTRALNTIDQRAPGVRFAVRKDLFDQGIDTMQKLAAWKRPDGKRAIVGVSSLGGTSHLWSHYFMERLELADKVTWVGVGNVDTMLGTLKSKQIDVLSSAISVTTEAEKNGWGKVIYAPSDEKIWNSVIGGPVPVNANFCLLATIEKEPEKVQAFTNAIWRSVQWIRANNADTILATIERFVGSTSREANLLEIGELKDVADWNGLINAESWARGEKVWYGELTGLKPIKMEDAVADRFLKAAHAKYPA